MFIRPRRRPNRLSAVALLALTALAGDASVVAARSGAPGASHARLSLLPFDTIVVTPDAPPPDFAIALEGGEGRAIPGEYHVLRIRIDHAGRGTFRVEPSLPDSPVVDGRFEVADSVVRQLHRASARLWTPRPAGPPANPGSVNSADLVLTGHGQTVRVNEPLLAPWDADARAVSRLVRRAVPDSLWARAGLASS